MTRRASPRLRLEQLDDRTAPAGLDVSFGTAGIATPNTGPGNNDIAVATTTLPGGKLLTLGAAYDGRTGDGRLSITRLNPDGTPDLTFGREGTVDVPLDGGFAGVSTIGRSASARLAIAPDGRMVVAVAGRQSESTGFPDQTTVARLNPDGSPDTTFAGDGVATVLLPGVAQWLNSLTLLPDGSIVLAGPEAVGPGEVTVFPPAGYQVPQPDEVVAVKLTPGGQPDRSFGNGGVARIAAPGAPTDARVAPLPDGRLLVYGEVLVPAPGSDTIVGPYSIAGARVFATRLTAAGAVDPTYGTGGLFEAQPDPGSDSIALVGAGLAPDGSLLVAIAQRNANVAAGSYPLPPAELFRVTPDGRADPAFAGDGRYEIDTPYLHSPTGPAFVGIGVVPLADGGSYLVGLGRAGRPAGDPLFPLEQSAVVVERLTPGGALDTTYGNGGVVVVPQSDLGPLGFVPFDAVADDAGRVVVSGRGAATNGDGFAELIRIAPDAPTSPLPPAPPPITQVTISGPFTYSSPGQTWLVEKTLAADLNGDGTDDTVTYSGPGGAGLSVRDGRTGDMLVVDFRPYEDGFTGGLVVAAADLNGDQRADLVVVPDVGGSARVEVLEYAGGQLVVRGNFYAFDDPNFRGGARIALGDMNADGNPDLVVAAGPGGGPRVAEFDGRGLMSGGVPVRLVGDYYAFPGDDAARLRDGVTVAAGDLNGDGRMELVFGAGPGGAPRIVVLDAGMVTAGQIDLAQADPVANFFASGDDVSRGGVAVAVSDMDGDGWPELYARCGADGLTRVYRDPAALSAAGSEGDPIAPPG